MCAALNSPSKEVSGRLANSIKFQSHHPQGTIQEINFVIPDQQAFQLHPRHFVFAQGIAGITTPREELHPLNKSQQQIAPIGDQLAFFFGQVAHA